MGFHGFHPLACPKVDLVGSFEALFLVEVSDLTKEGLGSSCFPTPVTQVTTGKSVQSPLLRPSPPNAPLCSYLLPPELTKTELGGRPWIYFPALFAPLPTAHVH